MTAPSYKARAAFDKTRANRYFMHHERRVAQKSRTAGLNLVNLRQLAAVLRTDVPPSWKAVLIWTFLALSKQAAAASGIDKILALPESKIDVGIAALTFAKEIYPAIDISTYSKEIDRLAAGAKAEIDRYGRRYGRHDPDSVIRTLNSYFYLKEHFHYDRSPSGRINQANYFINGILDTKQGQCVTMPMLYMAIAQRMGYPVYPVLAPEHGFLRFVSPGLQQPNIEATHGGGYSPDSDYAFRLNISEKAIRNGAYLRTLSYHEYLGYLLQQNAIVLANRGELDRAMKYFEKAQRIDPKNPYYSINIGAAWVRKARHTASPVLAEKYRAKAHPYYVRAYEMGFVEDPDANTRGKNQ